LNRDECLEKALNTLLSLHVIYNNADVAGKRKLIYSIYPEKLCYDGSTYRTTTLNAVVELMWLINKGLVSKKTDKS
jgi:site-specific DNA recombinase